MADRNQGARPGAPAPIRVLVVDDSVVVRKLVVEVLAADPEIEVVGTAANGLLALQKLDQLKPDVVTLDVEMPVLDGLETLTELRKLHPRLPVIMFSTLTERGASATFEALSRGASDYVTKPSNVDRIQEGMERVRLDLIPKVKALTARKRAVPPPRPAAAKPLAPPAATPATTKVARTAVARPAAPAAGSPAAPTHAPPATGGRRPAATPAVASQPARSGRTTVAARPGATSGRVDVVAIGVSTGGPNALAEVFAALPGNLPVPIVVVQHMPPVFTRLLAERLSTRTPVRVHEGVGGMVLEPGQAYLAPGDHHMVVRRSGPDVALHVHQGPPEHSCRPAVDPLFRSVAEVYGGHAVGIVLTGMGGDGTSGAAAMRQAGARILAQDEASSVVWGMPGHVVGAGLADEVVPLHEVAPRIVHHVLGARADRPVRASAPTRTR